MRRFKIITVLLLGFTVLSVSNAAESLFYSNISPAPFSYRATTLNLGFAEWADDAPFSGSHSISSFRISYTSSESV